MTRRDVRSVKARSSAELTREWDELATHRDDLITSGRDISYSRVLLPSLRRLIGERLDHRASLLDVGCGTGTFVAELARDFPTLQCVGIDPSPKSVGIAAERYAALANCTFASMSIERYADDRRNAERFDIIVANMLLQNVSSLSSTLGSCRELMGVGAVFIFAIPHPCFWPRYWQYENEQWFRYLDETWIDAPFQTSLSPRTHLRTTHTHRPLSLYVNALVDAGLVLDKAVEPMPDASVAGAYPSTWDYPRFFLGRCLRDPGFP